MRRDTYSGYLKVLGESEDTLRVANNYADSLLRRRGARREGVEVREALVEAREARPV